MGLKAVYELRGEGLKLRRSLVLSLLKLSENTVDREMLVIRENGEMHAIRRFNVYANMSGKLAKLHESVYVLSELFKECGHLSFIIRVDYKVLSGKYCKAPKSDIFSMNIFWRNSLIELFLNRVKGMGRTVEEDLIKIIEQEMWKGLFLQKVDAARLVKRYAVN